MKTIIAGSRDISWQEFVSQWNTLPDEVKGSLTEVVCGLARGPDTFGKSIADWLEIPVKGFKPDWDNQGKKAGILRNIEMGDYADQAIIVWDGKSKGTAHMISYMKKLNKPVYIFNLLKVDEE